MPEFKRMVPHKSRRSIVYVEKTDILEYIQLWMIHWFKLLEIFQIGNPGASDYPSPV